jgi:hypothetical protein
MRPWQKLLARAGHLRPLLLAHQSLPAPFPDAGLTTPEPNKSQKQLRSEFPCLPIKAQQASGPIASGVSGKGPPSWKTH